MVYMDLQRSMATCKRSTSAKKQGPAKTILKGQQNENEGQLYENLVHDFFLFFF